MPTTKPHESKHSTTGTFTAKSDVDGDFVGDALEMQLYKDNGVWYLGATQQLGSQPTEFKGIDLYVPGNIPEDGQTRTYEMKPSDLATARYWRYVDAGSRPYTSVEGTLTVAYFAVEQRMKGSFRCTASFGSEIITITDANFDLAGITSSDRVRARKTQGAFSATLIGGISPEFMSDSMNVKHDNQALVLTADQFVWDFLPPKQHRITLFINDGVKAGLHIFSKDDANIRAAYVTPNQETDIFKSISGELYLASDPTELHLKVICRSKPKA